jgi:type II secretory pathway component GspD/PulD (secretin)
MDFQFKAPALIVLILAFGLQPLPLLALFGKPKKEATTILEKKKSAPTDKEYTVNFDNISAIELVKFISRIGNYNFIYDENDLNFNVTFSSDEPTSLFNIISAFTQILRIHDLSVLEDGNNFVISKNPAVKQIPTIISDATPLLATSYPIVVTRVFNIHNANPGSIESIIRPMISISAQMILSQDTRQLIITESASNIEKIAELISILDQPKSSLEVLTYKAKNMAIFDITPLLTEILLPISEGNPLIIVPQRETNTVFIVSTPFLNLKATDILRDLDSYAAVEDRSLGAENIMLYQLKYRSSSSIEKSLEQIATTAEGQGFFVSTILSAIKTVRYIKPTNSLLFIGEGLALDRIKTLIDSIDVPTKPDNKAENAKFYLYEPANKSAIEIMSFLQDVEKHLKDSHLSDPALLQTLTTARVLKDANSIIFTGDTNSISEVQELLKSLDLSQFNSKDEYFIYTPINVSSQTLLESLHQMAERLHQSGLTDISFINALKECKYMTYSHAIVFTASKDAITKIKGLMNELDHPWQKEKSDQNVLIFQVKSVSKSTLEKNLDKFAETLPLESPLHEAIETAAWMPEANSFVFRGSTDTLKQIKEILDLSDSPSYSQDISLNYRVQNAPFPVLEKDIQTFASSLSNEDPTKEVISKAKWVADSKLIIFRGTKSSIDKISEFLKVADHPASAIQESRQQGYFLYNLQFSPGSIILRELHKIISKLSEDKEKNASLIKVIDNIEWVKTTNSLFISGSQADIDQVSKLIAKFDIPQKTNTHVMVPLVNVQGDIIIAELQQTYKRLNKTDFANDEFTDIIGNIERVKSYNSLFITGPSKEVEHIQTIIRSLDIPSRKELEYHSEFFVYTPMHTSPRAFGKAISKLAHDLKEAKLSDPVLINSLDTVRYNEDTASFVFTANEVTLNRIKELIAKIDVEKAANQNTKFYFYKPVNLTPIEFQKAIDQSLAFFKKDNFGDQDLVKALESMRFVKSSKSYVFTGSNETISNLEGFLKNIDQPTSDTSTSVFMYHPKNIPLEDLYNAVERFTSDLQSSNLADNPLIDSLKSMKLVKGSHALIFTGNKDSLPQVEEFVTKLDSVAPFISSTAQAHFFMYRPTKGNTVQIETAMKNIASDLEKSGLANPEFIKAIKSVRYVSSTNSLVFTGSEDALARVQELVKQVEVDLGEKSGIQQVGKTTFFIYKVKEIDPHQLMNSLTQVTKDLTKNKGADPDLIKTIQDMRFVPDNHTIIFTGSEDTLKQVQDMIKDLDQVHLSTKRISTEEYLLYKPKNISGDELIHLAKDFEQNLINSGVSEPKLFDTINNLKWMAKTGQVIISGTSESTAKVQALLEKFDVHSDRKTKSSDNAIETLDNVSFLIYKIQFHQGADIQGVLAGIATDLSRTGGKGSMGLVNAINSLQWLKVTNSFIATGEPATLIKLKELLESVDVPLKQVFIEILVLETELDGRLEFGLQWGSQGTYKDRMAFSVNSAPLDSSTTGFTDVLSKVSATAPPAGTSMPIPNGGSLGVIGDLIFNQGKTYVSLGDFVNAIQTDSDSTIVLNQQIIAQDNQNATLFVGQNIPYNGSVVQTQGNTQTISANIEYRDIGIMLSLVPNIGDNDIISLDIDQTITEDESTGSSSGNVNEVFGIKTSKTTMKTKVHVPNKHFVILSGQIRNTTVRIKTGIPCLGGLPLIGAAFSNTTDTKARHNIVMFMRPVIINSYDEYRKLTADKEIIYRDQTIAEDFDAGIEMVKSVDDAD